MPKRKSFKSSKIRKKSKPRECIHECEKTSFDEFDEIVILPNPDDFGESDSEDDSFNDDGFCENIEYKTSYRIIFENYTQAQKKLEPDHAYEWINGEKIYSENLDDSLLLSESKKQIQNSTPLQLFELFFF